MSKITAEQSLDALYPHAKRVKCIIYLIWQARRELRSAYSISGILVRLASHERIYTPDLTLTEIAEPRKNCRPLPILTVDEFILLHEVIQAATSINPQAVNLLRNVRNAIGRNILGNLLDLGQVAFAPATPDVLSFADHMVKNHGITLDFLP